MADGGRVTLPGDTLEDRLSQSLFGRTGQITRIDVGIPADQIED